MRANPEKQKIYDFRSFTRTHDFAPKSYILAKSEPGCATPRFLLGCKFNNPSLK